MSQAENPSNSHYSIVSIFYIYFIMQNIFCVLCEQHKNNSTLYNLIFKSISIIFKHYTIYFHKMDILYEDKYITITPVYMTIRKYYFPLATSKTILFKEMSKISIEDGSNVNHRWGPSTRYLNNWFHLDNQRKLKERFLSITIKDSNVRPGVTPEDIDKVFDVLRSHFAQVERKSVIFESNRDKQTELAQKQVNEMMKQEIQHEKEGKEEESLAQLNSNEHVEIRESE